ncbi:MAG TPA: AraC family transcriptional regulator [Polyangiaceae bacterium]|nr:AraC family transcriptional regulator [Polyangiaceae bacterium]
MPRTQKKRWLPHDTILLPASLPGLHALLTPAVAHAFQTLGIGASLREKDQWYAIHVPTHAIYDFEIAHGREAERHAYNMRCIERCQRKHEPVLGAHAGFFDFFVPVGTDDTVHAVLVSGPFATARPTSGDVLERWHALTGRRGHPSDPEFSLYLSTTLQTLVLEGAQATRYQRMLTCFAMLCAGLGDARALAAEAATLREEVEQARFAARMWQAARSMVDPRTTAGWLSPHRVGELYHLGARGLPEHALVGLSLGRRDESDAVDEILRRDAFQRASVELARRFEGVICGRIADHGVVFLVGGGRSSARVRQTLTNLGTQAAAIARRRFGLRLHLGMSALTGSAPLSSRYEEALGAAERALSQGLSMLSAAGSSRQPLSSVQHLREQLASAGEESASALGPRFERYIEAVALDCGYRFDLVRAHLDAGFEQAARALASALDEKSRADLFDALNREARDSSTVMELFAAYRRAISDLVDAAERPAAAAQDRSLRRAITFLHRHFAEPLSLPRVARIAGFAPGYFSQLFKQRERMTLEQYVRRLRIERAKQLLAGTDIGVERVGQLSGFARRSYFHRVFKETVGSTPVEFRSAKE